MLGIWTHIMSVKMMSCELKMKQKFYLKLIDFILRTLFRRYGKVVRLDFIWNTTGPHAGLKRSFVVEDSHDKIIFFQVFLEAIAFLNMKHVSKLIQL